MRDRKKEVREVVRTSCYRECRSFREECGWNCAKHPPEW